MRRKHLRTSPLPRRLTTMPPHVTQTKRLQWASCASSSSCSARSCFHVQRSPRIRVPCVSEAPQGVSAMFRRVLRHTSKKKYGITGGRELRPGTRCIATRPPPGNRAGSPSLANPPQSYPKSTAGTVTDPHLSGPQAGIWRLTGHLVWQTLGAGRIGAFRKGVACVLGCCSDCCWDWWPQRVARRW